MTQGYLALDSQGRRVLKASTGETHIDLSSKACCCTGTLYRKATLCPCSVVNPNCPAEVFVDKALLTLSPNFNAQQFFTYNGCTYFVGAYSGAGDYSPPISPVVVPDQFVYGCPPLCQYFFNPICPAPRQLKITVSGITPYLVGSPCVSAYNNNYIEFLDGGTTFDGVFYVEPAQSPPYMPPAYLCYWVYTYPFRIRAFGAWPSNPTYPYIRIYGNTFNPTKEATIGFLSSYLNTDLYDRIFHCFNWDNGTLPFNPTTEYRIANNAIQTCPYLNFGDGVVFARGGSVKIEGVF